MHLKSKQTPKVNLDSLLDEEEEERINQRFHKTKLINYWLGAIKTLTQSLDGPIAS